MIVEIMNSMNMLNSLLDTIEKKINKLEGKPKEIIQKSASAEGNRERENMIQKYNLRNAEIEKFHEIYREYLPLSRPCILL